MKTLIIGFDSFDPRVFEELAGRNQLPNLEKFMEHGGYSRLEVCSPPQTEVSWTSMATGADPGGHGIFDFVHRDPATYSPYVSILPMRKTAIGEQFTPPYTAKTLFEEAAQMGYPATALWWPALFPARPDLPVNTLPGLGTPDIRGQLGVGTLFTSAEEAKKKTTVVRLDTNGRDRYQAQLAGPQVAGRDGPRTISLPVNVDVIDAQTARLTIENQQVELRLGQWSEIVELRFKAGMLLNIYAITRFILVSLQDAVRIYSLPLQIHPMHTTWNYASTGSFAKRLWKGVGPFLTLGWPQDTTGLEDGCITDDQFLVLCAKIFDMRIRIFSHLMHDFKEGVLASIFDDLDRIQHMFFHDRMDIVHGWYKLLDEYVGTVQQHVSQWSGKHRLLVLSDHGFAHFRKKIHLNRWLLENNYLALKNGGEDLSAVDWSRTKAYAVGLNSIYLNVTGREGQGIVAADDIESLLAEIKSKLLDWRDENQASIFQRIRLKHETFHGPYVRFGPDLVLGYAPGYRASAETGLGKIPARTIDVNNDHWGADHCIESDAVPGVILANSDLRDFGKISFRDVPFLAIGKHLDQSHLKPPSQATGQGQKDLEERLKGLGYL